MDCLVGWNFLEPCSPHSHRNVAKELFEFSRAFSAISVLLFDKEHNLKETMRAIAAIPRDIFRPISIV